LIYKYLCFYTSNIYQKIKTGPCEEMVVDMIVPLEQYNLY